jgi:hypothetical protein
MTTTIPIPRTAAELVVGDRIAAKFLPTGESADVVFTLNYASYDKFWTFVAFQFPDGVVESDSFLSNASIPLESLAYTVRDVEPEQVEAAPGVDATAVGRPAGRAVARPEPNRCAVADPHGPHRAEFAPVLEIEAFDCPGVDDDVPEGRVIGRAPVDEPASETS